MNDVSRWGPSFDTSNCSSQLGLAGGPVFLFLLLSTYRVPILRRQHIQAVTFFPRWERSIVLRWHPTLRLSWQIYPRETSKQVWRGSDRSCHFRRPGRIDPHHLQPVRASYLDQTSRTFVISLKFDSGLGICGETTHSFWKNRKTHNSNRSASRTREVRHPQIARHKAVFHHQSWIFLVHAERFHDLILHIFLANFEWWPLFDSREISSLRDR